MEVLFLYFFTSAADGNDCSVASPGHFFLGKDSLYPQNIRLSGPQYQSAHVGEEKEYSYPCHIYSHYSSSVQPAA
jgi:hypothetical protein